ncbi:MAG: hypothetical protein AAFP99_08255 [Pseudomonadota bacterium]
MTEVTNQLMYEVLKATQVRLNNLDDNVRKLRRELLAIGRHMAAIQLNISNLYAGQAKVEQIERRLDIASEPVQ